MTNAQAALEAASRVHQRVSGTTSTYLSDTTTDYGRVLKTADAFYTWLESHTTEGSK